MIYLMILVGYLLVGTLIARHVYAVESSGPTEAQMESAKTQMNAMRHRYDCYQKKGSSYYNANNACDCSNRNEWSKLRAISNGTSSPTNPYLVLGAWPGLGFHKFLTGGTAKKDDSYAELQAVIARQEKELNISK